VWTLRQGNLPCVDSIRGSEGHMARGATHRSLIANRRPYACSRTSLALSLLAPTGVRSMLHRQEARVE
jgi:hypothetical protein